jgi:hypothetical protein
MIADCNIFTGDDAICLKNTDPLGVARVCRNITVTNCLICTTCNAFKIDEQFRSRKGHENITFSNSIIYNDPAPDEDRAASGVHLETNDGGEVAGIVVSNIAMQNVRSPIFLRLGNRGRNGPRGVRTVGGPERKDAGRVWDKPGRLRDVLIENVFATGQTVTNNITGLPGFDIENVSLRNISIRSTERGTSEWAARVVPEMPEEYGEMCMYGRLPAYGFYFRHVNGLRLNGVEVATDGVDMRPAVVCDDVKNLDIEGLSAMTPGGGQPVIRLIDVDRGLIRGCSSPPGAQTFVRVEGERSRRIALVGNDLTESARAVERAANAAGDAVGEAGNLVAKA